MNKESLLFGVFGLIAGLIIGFFAANNINRSAAVPTEARSATNASAPGANPALPPDHPPLGTSSADQNSGMPRPEVMEAIERAKNEPRNFEVQMTAADLYYQIQRFDEAAKFYEAAAVLKPSELEPMIKLGNALYDAEKYEQAERWYRLALEKDPKNIDVRNDLGLTFFLREPRDTAGAVREFQKVLEFDPKQEKTLQNLTLVYIETGDKTGLRETLQRLKAVNPNNPAVQKAESSL